MSTQKHTPGPACEMCGDTRPSVPKNVYKGSRYCRNLSACARRRHKTAAAIRAAIAKAEGRTP